METNVIKEVFRAAGAFAAVSSIKSMVGESFSRVGCAVLTPAVGALRKEMIPPTANYRERDPLCDLDYVSQYSTKESDAECARNFGRSYWQTRYCLGRQE